MERTKLTRLELYELVWSEPVTRLAKRFGISDVALAKTCRKHRIPRPARGYWQKDRAGYRVRPRRLPKLNPADEKRLGSVTLGPRPERGPPVDETVVDPQARFEAEPRNRIHVPDRLRATHSLIKQTREHWVSLRRHGYAGAAQRIPHLNIRVERESQNRSLRIMQALIRGLEKRGFEVVARSGRTPKTLVSVRGEEIEIRLYERSKKVERSAEPGRFDLGTSPWLRGPDYDLVPTGRLTLEICEIWGARKTWTDGKRQRLENCLNKFIVGLVSCAEAKRAWRQKLEKERRERERLALERAELERQRQREVARGRQLEKLAEAWSRANRIREFIVAIENSAMEAPASDDLAEWVEWARHFADRLDPLLDFGRGSFGQIEEYPSGDPRWPAGP